MMRADQIRYNLDLMLLYLQEGWIIVTARHSTNEEVPTVLSLNSGRTAGLNYAKSIKRGLLDGYFGLVGRFLKHSSSRLYHLKFNKDTRILSGPIFIYVSRTLLQYVVGWRHFYLWLVSLYGWCFRS